MSIALPKDAEGREIPLDTTTLYTVDGTQCDVSHFTYYPKCKITEQSWHVVFDGGLIKRASRMYLTTPDSWSKLEDDLDRCIKESNLCMYYNQNLDCNNCAISGNETRGCTSIALEDIKKRIRKLRGED